MVAELLDHQYTSAVRVVFVPASRSPFKQLGPAPDEHRISMLKIALENSPNCEIWHQELVDARLNPDQPSYWADTWAIIQNMSMKGTNRFLIGADQAQSMHKWKRYNEFWKGAIVMLRQGTDSSDQLIEQLDALGIWSVDDLNHWRRSVIIVPTIDASSTFIRDALRDPTTRSRPIRGLDPKVHAYILEHALYLG